MRSKRLMLAVTALTAALALAGCGGDDSNDDEAAPSADPSAVQSARDLAEQAFERPCTVTVEVTGTAQASWQGKGTVTNASGVTTYQGVDGDNTLLAYAGNDDIPTSANITIGGDTYTTTDPERGLDIAEDGKNASVDADTTGVDGPGPHVTATFTCGKGGKG